MILFFGLEDAYTVAEYQVLRGGPGTHQVQGGFA